MKKAPHFVGDVSHNPYETPLTKQPANLSSEMKHILSNTGTAVCDILPGNLLVFKEGSSPEEIRAKLAELRLRYVFLMNADGDHVFFSGQTNGGIAEPLLVTSFSQEFADELEVRTSRRTPFEHLHTEDTTRLLGTIKGGMVTEIGAGDNHARILKLHQHTKANKAQFLCVDFLPATAMHGLRRRPYIPYIALPTDPRVMPEALKNSPHPHVWTANNVLTSLGFTSAQTLFECAEDSKVETFVATQTLGMSEGSPIFPPGLSPTSSPEDHSALHQMFNAIHNSLRQRSLIPQDHEVLTATLYNHAMHLYTLLCTEIFKDYCQYLGSQYGFTQYGAYFVEHTQTYDAAKVKDYFGNVSPQLNTKRLSPFGTVFWGDPRLGARQKKLVSSAWHMQFSRTPQKRLPKVQQMDNWDVTSCNVALRRYRSIDRVALLKGLSTSGLRGISVHERSFNQICAKEALKLTFEVLPGLHEVYRTYSTTPFAQYLKSEYMNFE